MTALGKLGRSNQAALQFVLEAAEGGYRDALEALRSAVPQPAAIKVLMGAIRDPDPAVRYLAITGLRDAGPAARAAVPLLQEAVKDEATTEGIRLGNVAQDALQAIQGRTADPRH